MKNLTTKIFLFFILLIFASCTTSQTDIQWSSLTYMYETGPLPPKYQYSYSVTLNTNCEGGVVCFIGDNPSNSSLIYEFKFSKDSLVILDDAIKKSKILEEEIGKLPEGQHPIGGHLEKVRVILFDDNPNLDRPPRVKESPYFPTEKYKANLQKLYEIIVSLVPRKIWDDFEAKKLEFQSKEK